MAKTARRRRNGGGGGGGGGLPGGSANFTFSLAAGASFDPLDGWVYQIPTKASRLSLIHNATATGVVCTVTALARNILQRSPVPAGGTAGVFPTIFNAPVVGPYGVGAMEKLSARYDNPTGGAITVNLTVDLS
jgi:hypothetical protein